MKAGRGVLAAVVVLLVAAICLGQAVLASPPFWETSYGGDRLEMGYSVQQTVDGGYILLGVTLSKGAGQRDAWLIKTDDKGKPLWDSTFGGGKDDWGRCVRQTVDGGYILAGSTFSLGAGQADAWLIKTDASGAKQWERVFGGSEVDLGCAVQQTDDGGYVLVGWTESKGAGSADAWLIKTNRNGLREWERTFGGGNWDAGYSVEQTSDGGYVLLGHTKSRGAGKSDAWLIKTDARGNQLWETVYGGPDDDVGRWLRQTRDGGYILVGWTKSKGAGGADIWLIRTDADGTRQWERTFGGGGDDWGRCVQQTRDGGCILLGSTTSFNAEHSYDFWLIKVDGHGTKLWDKTFGTPYWDRGRHVEQTTDGGYVLIGYKFVFEERGDYQIWLIKTDSHGH